MMEVLTFQEAVRSNVLICRQKMVVVEVRLVSIFAENHRWFFKP